MFCAIPDAKHIQVTLQFISNYNKGNTLWDKAIPEAFRRQRTNKKNQNKDEKINQNECPVCACINSILQHQSPNDSLHSTAGSSLYTRLHAD